MDNDWTGAFVVFGIICALSGWVVIEAGVWIFSHISFGWIA
ncbi:hypothetical protein [Pseudomonas sp. NA-150]